MELNSLSFAAMNLPEIIEAAGGPAKIAPEVELSESAIRKWVQIGIPDRHWAMLIEMGGGQFDERDIYRANCEAPGRVPKEAAA